VLYGYQGRQVLYHSPSNPLGLPVLMAFPPQVSQGQSHPWRVPPITLDPHLSIGSSGSTGQPQRRLPRIGKGKPSRRCTLRVSPPLLFGILRMKMADHLFLKAMTVKETRYGKAWKTRRIMKIAVAMTKTGVTRTTSHRPSPRSKGLVRDNVVLSRFIGTKKYVIIRYNHVPSDALRSSGHVKIKMQHRRQLLGKRKNKITTNPICAATCFWAQAWPAQQGISLPPRRSRACQR